jgi:hypothetical protein
MLDTVRLLEAELQKLANEPQPVRVMPTKITVMMPSATKMYAGQQNGQAVPNQRNTNVNGAPANVEPEILADTPDTNIPDSRYMPPATPAPAPAPVPAPATATLEKPLDRGQWPFNPLADKPTDRFTLSQRAREVNDVIGLTSTSLNDKLKSEVADLKSALNDTPVRDLKKAIGVNDRYVFINQLFRGDEVMYERSIKTINGFRILPEAEYWMERELKVKLGWDENRETTRHFYQLVKRRFS